MPHPSSRIAPTLQVSCYAAGTNIATTRGQMLVEAIRPGMFVCTVLGADTGAVVWAGHREVDCTRHPDPIKVWPVRIAAGTFGRGMPETDLFLSPDHAIFVDRVLVPVRLLIDGGNIRQELTERITYHHIQLARHDVLLANGMPAESCVDAGARARFSHGGAVIALHPDFSARDGDGESCAPLVSVGAALMAVRKRLAAEAARRRRRARHRPMPRTMWPG